MWCKPHFPPSHSVVQYVRGGSHANRKGLLGVRGILLANIIEVIPARFRSLSLDAVFARLPWHGVAHPMVPNRSSWQSLGALSASCLASEASYSGDGSPNHHFHPSAVISAATLGLIPYRLSASVRGTEPRKCVLHRLGGEVTLARGIITHTMGRRGAIRGNCVKVAKRAATISAKLSGARHFGVFPINFFLVEALAVWLPPWSCINLLSNLDSSFSTWFTPRS